MTSLDLKGTPHRRFNHLSGAWVLVSPHLTQRLWQGQLEQVQKETPPSYDPSCYMRPGNKRGAGPQIRIIGRPSFLTMTILPYCLILPPRK